MPAHPCVVSSMCSCELGGTGQHYLVQEIAACQLNYQISARVTDV